MATIQIADKPTLDQVYTAVQAMVTKLDEGFSEKAYTPGNTLLKTVLGSEVSTGTPTNTVACKLVAKWVPEYSGQVKLQGSLKQGTKSGSYYQQCRLLAFTGASMSHDDYDSLNVLKSLESVSVGALTTANYNLVGYSTIVSISSNSGQTSYTSGNSQILVQKGVPVYFALYGGYESNQGGTNTTVALTNSIKIYADEV